MALFFTLRPGLENVKPMRYPAPGRSPYQPMPRHNQVAVAIQPRSGRPSPRATKLGGVRCLVEAKDFLGADYWQFWGLGFVGMIIAGVIPLILVGPMYCGLGFCFLAKERGQQASFELMFKGFDQLMNTLVPVLLYSLIALVVLPFYIGGVTLGMICIVSGIASAELLVVFIGFCSCLFGFLAMLLASTVTGYGTMFATFLVAEYDLEGMEAFKIALEGVRKNYLGLLGILAAKMIFMLVSGLFCYIPLFFIFPIFIATCFLYYRKIFQAPRKSSENYPITAQIV